MLHKNLRREQQVKAFLYSSHASDSFNRRLHGILKDFARDLADRIGDDLCAIVVGGSYGRGLGRYVKVNDRAGSGVWSIGQAPNDDIDIVLVLEKGFAVSEDSLNAVFRRYSAIMQTPIDLLAIVRRDRLERVPVSASWLELLWAHRVIFGPEDILDNLRIRIDAIPHGDEAIAFHERNGRDLVRVLRTLKGIGGEDGPREDLELTRIKSVRLLVDAVLIASRAFRADPFARLDALKQVADDEHWFDGKHHLIERLSEIYAEMNAVLVRDPGDLAIWKEIVTLWSTISEYIERKCMRKGYFDSLRRILSSSHRSGESDSDWHEISSRYI